MQRRRSHILARALMHPIRALLGQRIHAAGTTSLTELVQASGHDLAVVRYHVEALVALGLVRTGEDGEVSAAA